jgi:hypothetical protein
LQSIIQLGRSAELLRNQIKVYTSLIQKRKEWELVEIFADEGLSGMKAETAQSSSG